MTSPAPPTHDLACWLALAAAGIRGACRDDVKARGPCRSLADGRVGQRRFDPAAALAKARLCLPFLAAGGRVLGAGDPGSLGLLGTRARAPLCAFGRGGLQLEGARPAVAVVGARDASEAGLGWARRLAEDLVHHGAVVVSGGARGIDRAAHEAALGVGGETVAVLGEAVRSDGEDERPLTIRGLFDAAPRRALSVAVYGPWVPMARGLFAARNHFIAALADAVVIVEGRAGSGTLHTAEAARRLGVPLWCIPGDVDTSAVPNLLLRDGRARWLDPRRAAGAILNVAPRVAPPGPMRPTLSVRAAAAESHRGPRDPGVVHEGTPDPGPSDAAPLLAALAAAGGALLIDDAARTLGLCVPDLLVQVTLFEMEGRLSRHGAYLRLGAANPAGPGTRRVT